MSAYSPRDWNSTLGSSWLREGQDELGRSPRSLRGGSVYSERLDGEFSRYKEQRYNERIQQLEDIIQGLKQELEIKSNKIEYLDDYVTEIKRQKGEIMVEVANLQREKIELLQKNSDDIHQLERMYEQSIQQLQTLDQNHKRLQEDYNTLLHSPENYELKQKLSYAQVDLERVKNGYELKLRDMRQTLDYYQRFYEDSQRQPSSSSLARRVSELEGRLLEAQQQIRNKAKENEELQQEMNSYRSQRPSEQSTQRLLQKQQLKNDQKIAELQAELDIVRKKNQQLENTTKKPLTSQRSLASLRSPREQKSKIRMRSPKSVRTSRSSKSTHFCDICSSRIPEK